MRKSILRLTVLMLILSLCACGKKDASSTSGEEPKTGEMNSTEVSTDEVTPELTEAPTLEPTEAPTPEPTEAPTPEPTEAPTPEPTEAPTPEPTEAPTPEPTEAPTPEPTEAPTPVPDNSTSGGGEYGDGSDLAYSESITLPSGAVMPVLNKFNTLGLDPNNSFWGDWNSSIVAANMDTYIAGLDSVVATWDTTGLGTSSGTQNFLYGSNSMAWYMDGYDGTPSIEVKRTSNGYYMVCINVPLDTGVAHQLGKTWDDNDTARSREALTCLLACVTPDVTSVQNAMLDTLYYASSGSEPIPLGGTWATFGSSKVRMSAYSFENGSHSVVFHIAPK